jgi:hypothetical protein
MDIHPLTALPINISSLCYNWFHPEVYDVTNDVNGTTKRSTNVFNQERDEGSNIYVLSMATAHFVNSIVTRYRTLQGSQLDVMCLKLSQAIRP